MNSQTKIKYNNQSNRKWALTLTGDLSERKAARAASVWYLFLVVFSIFGGMLIDSRFFEPAQASMIMENIQSEEWLYRLGIAGFFAGQLCQLFVMFALYKLFRPVDKDKARTLFAYVVVMVPIAFVISLGKFAPLILSSDLASLQSFDSAQLSALSMLFIRLQNTGIVVLEIFWGLWLLPLGLLVMKSGLFPRVLGILLIIGCAGHIMMSFTLFVSDAAGAFVLPIANALAVGELPFFLWLIIFGVRNFIKPQSRQIKEKTKECVQQPNCV